MLIVRAGVKVLTTPELAAVFRVTHKTALNWLSRGQVPGAFKTLGGVRGSYRIPVESVAELLRRGYCPADPDEQAELAGELAQRATS